MNLTFKEIRLVNFFSFVDSTLELDDLGYVKVSGENKCVYDHALSNGSGKSSVFNGICYALIGETVQGISSGIENIFGDTEDCRVELTLNVDDDELKIIRIKTPKPDLKLYLNGDDISGKGLRETSKILLDYIPCLTSELVASIVILGQGLPYKFSKDKPARRKEVLENLTNSNAMIETIREKLDLRETELKHRRDEIQTNIATNSAKLDVYQERLHKIELDINDFKSADKIDVNTTRENITNNNSTIDTLTTELNTVISDISNTTKNIKDYNSENLIKKNDLLKSSREEILELNKKLSNLSAEKKLLDKEVKRLADLVSKGICPTCGQSVSEEISLDLSTNENEINNLVTNISSLESELKLAETNQKKISDEFDKNSLIKLNELSDVLSTLNKKQTDLNKKISELSNANSILNYDLKKALDSEEKIKSLSTEKETVNKSIESLKSELVEYNKINDDLNARLDLVQFMTTKAKREFRGILLSNLINHLNSKIRKYSTIVFNNNLMKVELNGNNIDIIYCDKLYENLSGGEKQKLDIIIQLALRSVLSDTIGIHSNILVLDEIFDNLDKTGCDDIMKLVSSLSDISSIFIISHHTDDLDLVCDNEVVVQKQENGISTIKLV